jgi:hypothetical protein
MKGHCIFTLNSVQFHHPQLAIVQDNTHRLNVGALRKEFLQVIFQHFVG